MRMHNLCRQMCCRTSPRRAQAAAPLMQQQERVDAEEAARARLERIKSAAAALAGRRHGNCRTNVVHTKTLLFLTPVSYPYPLRSEDDFTDSRYAPQLCNQDGTEMRLPEADRKALVLGLLLHGRGQTLLEQARKGGTDAACASPLSPPVLPRCSLAAPASCHPGQRYAPAGS